MPQCFIEMQNLLPDFDDHVKIRNELSDVLRPLTMTTPSSAETILPSDISFKRKRL